MQYTFQQHSKQFRGKFRFRKIFNLLFKTNSPDKKEKISQFAKFLKCCFEAMLMVSDNSSGTFPCKKQILS